jgi:hypothetical protein
MIPQNREKDPALRGKLCPELAVGGMCQDMHSTCDYSHTVDEARMYNQYFKTKVCGFAANGHCKKGNLCRYAHSVSELHSPIEIPQVGGYTYADSNTCAPVALRTLSTAATESETPDVMSPSSSCPGTPRNGEATTSSAPSAPGPSVCLNRTSSGCSSNEYNRGKKKRNSPAWISHHPMAAYGSYQYVVPSSSNHHIVGRNRAPHVYRPAGYLYPPMSGNQPQHHLLYANGQARYMFDPSAMLRSSSSQGSFGSYVQYED